MVESNPKLRITLRAARVNAGLTQATAAAEIGVSQAVVCNWERFKTYPDARVIPGIERAYGVKYDDIIFLPEDNALSVTSANKTA